LVTALFTAGKAQALDRWLLYVFGGVYVLLSWGTLLIVKFVERRPLVSLGFQWGSPLRTMLWAVGVFFLNAVLLIIEIWYRLSFGGESIESVARPIPNMMIELIEQLVWIGLPEEFVNRGYLLTRLRESWGTRAALFVSSFLFGASHLALRDPTKAIQAGLSGLIYGIAFLKTNSICAPAAAHILGNMTGSAIVGAIFSH
jgi:membrane protease YdiL (CAAX protease family)